jgi:hypothetical protein
VWVLSCAPINPESGAREGSAPFRADLVCQDRNSEELILIENQLCCSMRKRVLSLGRDFL